MCMIEQMLSLVPMAGPMITQATAVISPVIDGAKSLFKPALAGVAVLALAGCYGATPARDEGYTDAVSNANQPAADTELIRKVSKFCDEGRAVYVYENYNTGGVAVVENAAECPQPQKTNPAEKIKS